MELLAGKYQPGGGTAHFDHPVESFILMFQVLTGAAWSSVMDNAVAARGNSMRIYFITFNIIVTVTMLNVIVSVFVEQFAEAQAQIVEAIEEQKRLVEAVARDRKSRKAAIARSSVKESNNAKGLTKAQKRHRQYAAEARRIEGLLLKARRMQKSKELAMSLEQLGHSHPPHAARLPPLEDVPRPLSEIQRPALYVPAAMTQIELHDSSDDDQYAGI